MSLIRSKDTGPEMAVRRVVHGMGYRYRLHRRDLPGHPDLVFPSRRKVIFVHGCFWHQHKGCKVARRPKSNKEYWLPKLRATKERDARNQRKLKTAGWNVMIVWECQIKDLKHLPKTIGEFLG